MTMRWLWSGRAIEVHLVFGCCAGLFTRLLVSGDRVRPAAEYRLMLFLCGIAYVVALALVWVNWRINGGSDR
jgi:hypothetical protein